MLKGFALFSLFLFGIASRADSQLVVSTFNDIFYSEHVEIIQSPSTNPFMATALIKQNSKFIVLEGDYSDVDPDVLSLVLCHELGHAVGEYPLRPAPLESDEPAMYACEGAADYYATNSCLKKLWANDSGRVYRSINAALMFLNVTPWPQVSLYTPDLNVVEKTNSDSYPSRQCRLDTFVAGALDMPRPVCWFKE